MSTSVPVAVQLRVVPNRTHASQELQGSQAFEPKKYSSFS
jgi:hypothetical protein